MGFVYLFSVYMCVYSLPQCLGRGHKQLQESVHSYHMGSELRSVSLEAGAFTLLSHLARPEIIISKDISMSLRKCCLRKKQIDFQTNVLHIT